MGFPITDTHLYTTYMFQTRPAILPEREVYSEICISLLINFRNKALSIIRAPRLSR